MERRFEPAMETGLDFSELIPEALALAQEIDRIHALADGKNQDSKGFFDGKSEKTDKGRESSF